MIYCEVLVSRNPIINAHGKMNYPPPILSNDCPPIEDIDAAILSTCRTIYEETYPILYSYNQFIFQSIEELRIFGASGANKQPERLSRMTPLLRHQIECYGRLAMLRTVTLRLGLPDRAAPSPMVARTCWLAWFELFTFHTNPNLEAIRFPVLEVLVLGFTDWRLTASKGHRVRVRSLPCPSLL